MRFSIRESLFDRDGIDPKQIVPQVHASFRRSPAEGFGHLSCFIGVEAHPVDANLVDALRFH